VVQILLSTLNSDHRSNCRYVVVMITEPDNQFDHGDSEPASKSKGKVFPYSLPSVGPGADPGVQAVSPQVT